MTHQSLRNLILAELVNDPGTCAELSERLRSRGHNVVDTNVHRELRRLTEDDLVLESVADFVRHMKRTHAELGGTVTYELATAEAAE